VDRQRLTQVGRAMRELHIEMIPAYSPQARGRSERSFGTWQGRLPQELRLRGINSMEEAKPFFCGRTTSRSSTVNFPSPPAQARERFCSGQRKRSRAYLYGATGTGGQPGQHRTDSQPHGCKSKKTKWRGTLAKCRGAGLRTTWDGTWSVLYARTW